MGILIWSEGPSTRSPTRYLGQPGWRTRAYSFLQQNILADENHPSVMLWSIANELPTPVTANEAGYISGAAALARKLDPTRPVGMAISDWPGVPCRPRTRRWRDRLQRLLRLVRRRRRWNRRSRPARPIPRLAARLLPDAGRSWSPSSGSKQIGHGPVEERGSTSSSRFRGVSLGVFATKSWLSGHLLRAPETSPPARMGGGNPCPNPPWVQKGLVDQLGQPQAGVRGRLHLSTPSARSPPMRRVAPRPRTRAAAARRTPKRRRPAASRSGSPAT